MGWPRSVTGTSIGCLRALPSMYSFVMVGQKNLWLLVFGLSRNEHPSGVRFTCVPSLYVGRVTALPHAVSKRKIGSTSGGGGLCLWTCRRW